MFFGVRDEGGRIWQSWYKSNGNSNDNKQSSNNFEHSVPRDKKIIE